MIYVPYKSFRKYAGLEEICVQVGRSFLWNAYISWPNICHSSKIVFTQKAHFHYSNVVSLCWTQKQIKKEIKLFLFFSKKSVKKISKYKYYILPYSKTYGAFCFISLQNDVLLGYISTVPEKMSYQKRYVPSKWLLDFDKYGYGRHVDIKWKSFNVPLIRFQMKNQIYHSNFY